MPNRREMKPDRRSQRASTARVARLFTPGRMLGDLRCDHRCWLCESVGALLCGVVTCSRPAAPPPAPWWGPRISLGWGQRSRSNSLDRRSTRAIGENATSSFVNLIIGARGGGLEPKVNAAGAKQFRLPPRATNKQKRYMCQDGRTTCGRSPAFSTTFRLPTWRVVFAERV